MTYVARESGLAFEAALRVTPGNPVGELVLKHSLLANQLFYIMIGFAAIGLLNVFAVRKSTADGAHTAKQPAIIRIVLPILLVAVAVVAVIWIVRVGDLGARAVWNPTAPPLFNFP